MLRKYFGQRTNKAMAGDATLKFSVECVDEPLGRSGVIVYGRRTFEMVVIPRTPDGHNSSVVCFHTPAHSEDGNNMEEDQHSCTEDGGGGGGGGPEDDKDNTEDD
ncbi:uncharacterized protein LOC144010220 [Festucalex cinctus]